jgi:hypothetical protein
VQRWRAVAPACGVAVIVAKKEAAGALITRALEIADNAPGQAVIDLLHAQEALLSYIISELGPESKTQVLELYDTMQREARTDYADNRERLAAGVETPKGSA